MPNWVTNSITATNDDGDQIPCNKIIDRMRWTSDDNVSEQQAEEEISFHKVLPMPDELVNTTYPNNISKEESDRLIDKYGHDNWYHWAWYNWGTKWDLHGVNFGDLDDDGNIYSFGFQTAWATPDKFITALSLLVKDVWIVVEYADEDYGSNYGTYTCRNGEVHNESCYDWEDYQSGNPEAVRILKDLQGEPYIDEEEEVF